MPRLTGIAFFLLLDKMASMALAVQIIVALLMTQFMGACAMSPGLKNQKPNANLAGVIKLGTDSPGISVNLKKNGVVLKTVAATPDGKFEFTNVEPGTYEVVPDFADWIFHPVSQTVGIANGKIIFLEFSVFAEGRGNTEEELRLQDESLEKEPFPGWDENGNVKKSPSKSDH